MSLPMCCEESLVRGERPSDHALVCEHRPPSPPAAELEIDTLFDLPDQPEEGGQHL